MTSLYPTALALEDADKLSDMLFNIQIIFLLSTLAGPKQYCITLWAYHIAYMHNSATHTSRKVHCAVSYWRLRTLTFVSLALIIVYLSAYNCIHHA